MISRSCVNGKHPVRNLGDIVEFLDGQRKPVTESDRKPGPYPYFGANGQQGTIDGFIFDEPLVLLAEDGGHFETPDRGIAYRIGGKTWVNNHAHVLRPKPQVDLAYLCRVLENYDVTPFVTGTTRGKLTKGGAEQIPIPLPPLPEQRRIAAILDKADALRAKRRAALDQLNDLTQAVFVEMFGDPATNPKGWKCAPLATVCSIAGEYGSGVPAVTHNPTLPRYVRITDINEDGNLLSARVSPGGTSVDWADLLLEEGDVLFARSGATVGKTFNYDPSDGPCVFAGYLIRFRTDRSQLLPETLFYFTRTAAYIRWVAARQRVVAQPNINAQQYGFELKIPVPPIRLQQEFATRVNKVVSTTNVARQATTQLDTLFASLQHQAFSGAL